MAFTDSFPGFRLRMTRWGLAYLAACVVLGLAAVNTGNNALMAILGLALGSYVVSGLWSRQVLGSVEARVKPPSEVFAGRPFVVEVEIRNRSRIFPAYGLVVRNAEGGTVLHEPCLGASATGRHSVEAVFPERGWHRLGPWRLDVVMPLGFFLKSKTLAFEEPVLVYPRLLPRSRLSVRAMKSGRCTGSRPPGSRRWWSWNGNARLRRPSTSWSIRVSKIRPTGRSSLCSKVWSPRPPPAWSNGCAKGFRWASSSEGR